MASLDVSRVFEDEELGHFSHELGQADIKVVEEREQVHHPDVTRAALVQRDRSLGQAHGLCSALLRDLPQETNLPETRPDRPRQRTLRWLALRHVVAPSLSMAAGTTPRKPRRTGSGGRDFYDELQPHATGQIYVNFLGEEDDTDSALATTQSVYGASYERLVDVKTKYDPE